MKKKGIIIVAILAIVAVVLAVVFIMLFKDKDTTSLAKNLNTSVTEEYLDEDGDEYTTIHAYLEDYAAIAGVETTAKTEAYNYLYAYEAYINIAVFFNNEAPFMEYTKTYKTNRRKIVKDLNAAQKAATQLIAKIDEYRETTGGSELWQTVVWNNCKEYVEDIISNTMDAFERMANVYKDSVASNLLNNDLTDVLFMGMKNLNSSFKENVSVSTDCGLALKKFGTLSFSQENVEKAVLYYSYTSENNQSKMQDIKQKGAESYYWPDVLDGNILFL